MCIGTGCTPQNNTDRDNCKREIMEAGVQSVITGRAWKTGWNYRKAVSIFFGFGVVSPTEDMLKSDVHCRTRIFTQILEQMSMWRYGNRYHLLKDYPAPLSP